MVSIVGPNLALFLLIIQLRTVISESTSEGALEQRLLAILNNFKPCHGGRHHDSTSEESGSSEEADCKCKLRHHRHHKPCQEPNTTEKPSDTTNVSCPACPEEKICPTVADCPVCPTQKPTNCPTCPTVAPSQPITCPACSPAPSCPAAPNCPAVQQCPTCPAEKICPIAPACPTQTQVTEKPKTSCDAEWKYLNTTESCYFVGNNTLNATDAQKICRDHGGDLASIHSDAENDFIKTYINSTLSGGGAAGLVWIGQYRTGPTAADFRNFDGTAMDYIKFRADTPDNYKGQQYCNSMITYRADWYGLWDDNNCPTALEYVCKKPANKL